MPATRGLKPPRPRWLLGSVLTAWLSLPAHAQVPAQTQLSTRNSSEVAFSVGTKNGKSQFYLGEVIPLELTFTSKVPKRYQVNMRQLAAQFSTSLGTVQRSIRMYQRLSN